MKSSPSRIVRDDARRRAFDRSNARAEFAALLVALLALEPDDPKRAVLRSTPLYTNRRARRTAAAIARRAA